jgi:hypothetical protein
MVLLVLLSGCGGKDAAKDEPVLAPPPPPARGSLVGVPSVKLILPTAALQAQLSTSLPPTTLALLGALKCDLVVLHIQYVTVGAANESAQDSAAVMIPAGSNPACTGPRPLLLYAHGSTTDKKFDISDLSNGDNAEGLILAALFAAQGYIVVAPNYGGYDTSTLAYHPYLQADTQSKEMIDALAAARGLLPIPLAAQTTDSGKLYLTGYSEGGYVTLATQRAMQAAGVAVSASAPMSGPYAVAALVDAIFAGQVNAGSPVYFTFLLTAYQKGYGNIYASTADAYEASYATGIDSLLPTTLNRSDLYSMHKLPQSALFSSTPPDASFAAQTPATQPTGFATLFAAGFGTDNLIRNSYRLGFLQDMQANPDGGFPVISSGQAAANPAHSLRQALKRNDLRDFVPTAPTLLCGGAGDPTVYWLNTDLEQKYWVAHASSSTSFAVLDLDGSGDPYAGLKTGFSVLKTATAAAAVLEGATDLGAAAVLDAYHNTLVPPFCLAAVQSFFSAH